MREGERKKAERCLVDIHREDYEVMQRWLQSSPMLHTSIESPSHPSLQTPLATTIKLSAVPLSVKFSLFFPSSLGNNWPPGSQPAFVRGTARCHGAREARAHMCFREDRFPIVPSPCAI